MPEGQHGIKQHTDGGWDAIPVQIRSERFSSTNVADFPEVTGREENWRFTPVAKLGEFFTGDLDGSQYSYEAEPVEGVSVSWVARDDVRVGSAGLPEDRASANAWGQFDKALAVDIAGEEAKVFTLARGDLGDQARAAHTVITAQPYSQATIVLVNDGGAQLTENVEIVVREGASLTVLSLQQWADDAKHLASHFGHVERDASLKHIVVSLDGQFVRINPSVRLAGAGANIDALGLYYSDPGQHLEQQVFIHHAAPNSRSRVNYKGALQGKGARTVWIGDVLIARGAEGTDSYEQNRNLMLTEGCRADSVPNLEIEIGEIAGAGHASTTGRFDDEQLFYLQSRGIPELDARRLVVRGFLNEIVQQIEVDWVQERLHRALESELEVTGA